jgi:hypothetical protein
MYGGVGTKLSKQKESTIVYLIRQLGIKVNVVEKFPNGGMFGRSRLSSETVLYLIQYNCLVYWF